MTDLNQLFQTPLEVARYMTSMIPDGTVTVLEPTAGNGNILRFLNSYTVTAPVNYFDLLQQKFDCVIMNPPFSSKYVFGIPNGITDRGMKIGYRILFECMEMSDHVIALMPWFLLLDSSVRMKKLIDYGLKSITALPRSTFDYARIQCAIFELERGFCGTTTFRDFKFDKAERSLLHGQKALF